MRVLPKVHELALPPKGVVHEARRNNVALAVWSLLEGKRASLTAIGRGLEVAISDKHRIKRCDRLLGNEHLFAELPSFYAAVARRLLAGVRRPVLLIDWTSVHTHTLSLVIAVPVEGRAIPIYVELVGVPMPEQAMRRAERTALARLNLMLPHDVRPILVADAGFRSGFMRDVTDRGWDFVIRVRARTHIRLARGDWAPPRAIYAAARPRSAADLGQGELAKRPHPTSCRFILSRRPRKGPDRSRWYPTRLGNARASARRAAKEPLLLATSILDLGAAQLVALYARRMRIEETFRDAKTARYGWFLEVVRSRRPARWAVLWLIVTLAMLVVILLGMAAERRGLHRAFQANTTRAHRTLSWFTLGAFVLRRPPRHQLVVPNDLAFLAHLLGVPHD